MKKAAVFLILTTALFADPLEESEKNEISEFIEEITPLRESLKEKYEAISSFVSNDREDIEYKILLEEIKLLKGKIFRIEDNWRKTFTDQEIFSEEGYALWDQGDTTLSQLIMEYGSVDYLYVIPPELSNMKIQIFSGIPIPRESWDSMVEMILSANGVGVKRINAYVKQLYILKQDLSSVKAICNSLQDLELLEPRDRIFYVFTPEPEQVKAIQSFFERFSDPKETTIHSIGSKVILVSSKENVQKLISLHAAVWEKDSGKMIRVINLKKIDVEEAEKVLKAFFPDNAPKVRSSIHQQLSDELIFLSLPQGLVLIGEPDAIEKAERVLSDLEDQLNDPTEMMVYWYSCKHSDPEDIAEVLEQVYESLAHSDLEKKKSSSPEKTFPLKNKTKQYAVKTKPSSSLSSSGKDSFEANFIVDPKTGSILMVVRRDQLPKIKALLKKIDVPKKMVQIDVLLVEKKIQDRSQTGINLLKLGTNAKRKETSLSFDNNDRGVRKGILDFIFARKGTSFLPGIDLTYNFLMAQNDIKINANPSVIAINHTSATISIVEEISINNGAVIVDAGDNPRSEKSFTRAQYGTILKMTPTVHLPDENEEGMDTKGFITLQTDITFDTTETSKNDRPPVTKRSIKNEVTVGDGETIILGGLRRMTSEKSEEKIPFLGDIPGIGKLFGMTSKTDHNTEMFIFITPKIIRNPIEDLRKIRSEELQKRAGDIPEFLERMEEAKGKEKEKLFENSLKLIFDRE